MIRIYLLKIDFYWMIKKSTLKDTKIAELKFSVRKDRETHTWIQWYCFTVYSQYINHWSSNLMLNSGEFANRILELLETKLKIRSLLDKNIRRGLPIMYMSNWKNEKIMKN